MYPALLVGLVSLLTCAMALAWHPIYLVVLSGLLLPFLGKNKERKIVVYAILIGGIVFALACFKAGGVDLKQAVEGEGVFQVENLSIVHSPFNRSYLYKGVLRDFQTREGKKYPPLSCSIFHSLNHPPLADRDYRIQGSLTQRQRQSFCLKPKRGQKWKALDNTFRWAQWRCDAKKRVSSYIKHHLGDPASATFLSALVTGDVEERTLRLDFSRLGLQHILAISGFHFSFCAFILHFLLRPFFSFKVRIPLLLLSLACYFFFLGKAPSILRAFCAIAIFLSAQWCNRRTSGLNALGAALIFELLFDPHVIEQLSFQLSFLCTGALLLFSRCAYSFLQLLFPERSPKELSTLPLLDRHGYAACRWLRKTLSLNCAVHLFALPVLLFLFHRFPLLSLFYNLFFPFCASLSLLLFVCALCTSILPPLSAIFHFLNALWTSWLLQLTGNPPAYFDIVWRGDFLSFPVIIAIVLFLLYLGMWLHLRIGNEVNIFGNRARHKDSFP